MSGNFTVYKSSAGSGKTFTLVKEYLRIALADVTVPPTAYKSILAITFTNKAAGEMKERVIRALNILCDTGVKDVMRNLLCEELKISEAELAKRSSALLQAILHNYSDFSISTIDSFVHRIVRTFALDLQLPLNFSIEMQAEKVLAACVDELSRKVGEDEQITKVLTEFSRSRVSDDKNWKVEDEIYKVALQLLKESAIPRLERLKNVSVEQLLACRNAMHAYVSAFTETLVKYAEGFFALMQGNGYEAGDLFSGRNGIYSYFNKIRKEEFSDEVITSTIQKIIEKPNWKSAKSAMNDADEKKIQQLFFLAEEKRKQGKDRYLLYSALLNNIYPLMMISEISKLVQKVKDEENIVFISEFNGMISSVVRNEPVPFVYERIGEKYKHFLLDEFQDTSAVQWQNLLPLLDNSLASGNFNLVVGDGKQSIYRWRGGEVEQFVGLPDVPGVDNPFIAERAESLQRNYNEKHLRSNFRSRKEVIDFNNAFYAHLQNQVLPTSSKRVYDFSEQTGSADKTGGFVSFDLINGEEEESAADLICEKTEKYIRSNVEECGYSFSDITVLVRNKRGGKLIADHLMSSGIPVISSESLLIAADEKVSVLVSLLYLVLQERSHVHEARVLRYLQESSVTSYTSFSSILNEYLKCSEDLFTWLSRNGVVQISRNDLLLLPLFDLCATLTYSFSLNENDALFLQYFLDEVMKFSRKNRESLRAFLDWWEQNADSSSAVLPEGANAVNIMTIHASKGLQFPVVICAFADWKHYQEEAMWIDVVDETIQPLSASLVSSPSSLKDTEYSVLAEEEKGKQLLDNVNLLYVATTRPEEHLHIISTDRNRTGFVDAWLRSFFAPGTKGEVSCERGQMERKASAQKPHAVVVENSLSLFDWRKKLQLQFEADRYTEYDLSARKREEGILFHEAMSRIYTREDVASLFLWLTQKKMLTSENANRIIFQIESLFDIPQFNSFFGKDIESLNEPEILLLAEKCRPDRIVFHNNETWIIDYKTGAEHLSYYEQLDKYSSALREIGYPRIRSFIVYVQENRIDELNATAAQQ